MSKQKYKYLILSILVVSVFFTGCPEAESRNGTYSFTQLFKYSNTDVTISAELGSIKQPVISTSNPSIIYIVPGGGKQVHFLNTFYHNETGYKIGDDEYYLVDEYYGFDWNGSSGDTCKANDIYFATSASQGTVNINYYDAQHVMNNHEVYTKTFQLIEDAIKPTITIMKNSTSVNCSSVTVNATAIDYSSRRR